MESSQERAYHTPNYEIIDESVSNSEAPVGGFSKFEPPSKNFQTSEIREDEAPYGDCSSDGAQGKDSSKHGAPEGGFSKHGAPDGGWGWMIVLASFLLQALTIGFTYTFGTVYMDLLVYFHDTKVDTAWIGSIQPALLYFVSVVAGPCMRRYGWRMVTITGTAISTIGYCASTLASHPYVLFVTYGVMTGVGFGLLYMTAIVTVQRYFDKKRSLATGIAVSGSGAGTMSLGLLARKLLDRYQWRVTLLIEGGIILVVGLLCAVLFKPLPPQNVQPDDENTPLMNQSTHKTYGALKDSDAMDSSYSQKSKNGTPSVTKLMKDKEGHSTDQDDARQETFFNKFESTFRLSLLKNPTMILLCSTVVCFSFGYHVPYTFTPQRAFDMFQIEAEKGTMLVSVMGLSNVASRLLCGWLGGYGVRLRHWMLGTAVLLCGVLNCFAHFFTTFPLLLVYCSIFGVFTGCFASMFAVVLVDLMGLEVIEYTIGICLAFASVVFLVASPIAGYIIEHTNSYDTAFLTVGIVQIIGGLLFYSIKPLNRCKKGAGVCYTGDQLVSSQHESSQT